MENPKFFNQAEGAAHTSYNNSNFLNNIRNRPVYLSPSEILLRSQQNLNGLTLKENFYPGLINRSNLMSTRATSPRINFQDPGSPTSSGNPIKVEAIYQEPNRGFPIKIKNENSQGKLMWNNIGGFKPIMKNEIVHPMINNFGFQPPIKNINPPQYRNASNETFPGHILGDVYDNQEPGFLNQPYSVVVRRENMMIKNYRKIDSNDESIFEAKKNKKYKEERASSKNYKAAKGNSDRSLLTFDKFYEIGRRTNRNNSSTSSVSDSDTSDNSKDGQSSSSYTSDQHKSYSSGSTEMDKNKLAKFEEDSSQNIDTEVENPKIKSKKLKNKKTKTSKTEKHNKKLKANANVSDRDSNSEKEDQNEREEEPKNIGTKKDRSSKEKKKVKHSKSVEHNSQARYYENGPKAFNPIHLPFPVVFAPDHPQLWGRYYHEVLPEYHQYLIPLSDTRNQTYEYPSFYPTGFEREYYDNKILQQDPHYFENAMKNTKSKLKRMLDEKEKASSNKENKENSEKLRKADHKRYSSGGDKNIKTNEEGKLSTPKEEKEHANKGATDEKGRESKGLASNKSEVKESSQGELKSTLSKEKKGQDKFLKKLFARVDGVLKKNK